MIDMRLGDCMDLMRSAPDKSWDLAIVDPPYGIGVDGQREDAKPHGSGKYHASKWTRKAHVFKGWDSRPDHDYFSELRRVSVNQIVWGGNYFTDFLPPSKGWAVWFKGQNDLTMSDCEMAWTSFDVPARQLELNRMALTLDGTIHPTQKPVALYKWLLSRYAKPGQTILDTHGGSGSIAIACHDLGFDLTWIEKDPDYYAAACARYKAHAAQLHLLEPEPERLTQANLDL